LGGRAVIFLIVALAILGVSLIGMAYDMRWFPFRYRRPK
jgi:hypothetical protein